MDLKIRDVAQLLSVSEKTIRRWLVEGKIPAYRLNAQYRFSRIEIENWMMSCKLGSNLSKVSLREDLETAGDSDTESSQDSKQLKLGIQQFSFYRAVNRGGVLLHVEGSSKEEIITNAMEYVAPLLGRDREMLTELLLDREKLMSTGINHGVAVPHSRELVFEGDYDVVVVLFPKVPIEYGALDQEPVHTLFFLFAGGDKRHLHLLAKIAHFSGDKEAQNFLQKRPDKHALLEYLKNWESEIEAVRCV